MSETRTTHRLDSVPEASVAMPHPPSPIVTRRMRTKSLCERAAQGPVKEGKIMYFCRQRGHGYITPAEGGDDIFVHISDIEGEFVPHTGDEVTYKLCQIPPKMDKYQAVHVAITNLAPNTTHERWEQCPSPHPHPHPPPHDSHAHTLPAGVLASSPRPSTEGCAAGGDCTDAAHKTN